MRGYRLICLILALCSLWPAVGYAQVVLGQVDDFQNGTTMSWTNGFVPDPVNVATGGPAGAGDRYLQVSSGTFGGGSRSIVFNQVQWIGNYASQGVVRVEMDLANFGTSALNMRYALRTSAGNSSTPGYVSTVAFTLPADGGLWHHAVFLLDAANLTPILSPPPLSTFMASVGDARILNAASPSLVGDIGSTRFGVDNITALAAVPEPATWLMIIASLVAGIAYVLYRRHQQHQGLNKVCEGSVVSE